MPAVKTLSLSVCVAVLFVALCATGQNIVGTITGTVWDPTHAAIPNAKVTITNTDLHTSNTATTNGDGFYTVTGLRAGPYEIAVEAPGFAKVVRSAVQLDVNQKLGVDFTMRPGAVENVVEVTAATPVLQTQSADINTVLQQRQVQDLPLNNGRYIDLALQSPAALQAPGQRSNPREGRFDINGNLSLQNNFVMNGVDNNSYSENGQEQSPQVVRPAADALREVNVQTRTYTADFGYALGAVINTEVRSGSNRFHGDAWEYNRTGGLAAEDYFAKRSGAPKPNLSWNQFGVAVGGPLIKDRTFWFADYQGTRWTQGQTGSGSVPTAQMKLGIFPSNIRLKDPSSIDPRLAGCVNTATNTINLTGLRTDGLPCGDPVGMKLVQLYPDAAPGTTTFTGIYDIPDNSHTFDVRVDHRINNSNNLFGVYDFYQDNKIDQRGPLPNILATGGFSNQFSARGQLASITFLHTFTPNLLNDIRVGYNRVKSNSVALAPAGNAGPSYGLNGLPGTFANGLPPIYVGSYSFLGTSPWRPQYQVSQVYQLLDNLNYTRGKHTLKFGFEFKRVANSFLDIQAPNGQINLNNNYTGDGVGDLLLGLVSSYVDTTPLVPHDRLNGYAAYAQDTMRITSTLTVNYGVRYEYFSPLMDKNGMNSNWDPAANNGRGALLTNYKGAFPAPPCMAVFQCVIQTNDTLVHPQKTNFAPRVGFAYHPWDKVVFRGGFGIFFQALDREGSSALLQNNPPQQVTVTFDNVTALQAPAAYLRSGFPAVPNTFNPTTSNLQAQQINPSTPYAEEYSFGPEFAVTDKISLQIAYVGQSTHHLRRLYPGNQGQIVTPGVGPVVFPYPDWNKGTAITILRTNGSSNYNALQLQTTVRAFRGLTTNLGYTWSKALGNVTDNLSTGTSSSQLYPQNAYDPRGDYGPLNFDQRHRLYVNWIYDLPFGHGRTYVTDGAASRVLGGWSWVGTYQYSTGVPITISAPDQSGTFSGNYRANCVANPLPSGFVQTVDQYMPKSSFAVPAKFTFGSCGIGTLYSWPHNAADMSLFKRITITEAKYFEFRISAFNVFNTPQFDVPNRAITSSNFGKTTSVADPTLPARITQLGLKFYW